MIPHGLIHRFELFQRFGLRQARESSFTFRHALGRALAVAASGLLFATLTACGGGPATTVNQPTSSGTSTANAYTGPAAENADVQAFKINLWDNIRVTNRCGNCHHEGGQSPMFARSDDVNQAYQAALPLVNLTNPAQSTLVQKVGSGHNCWLADAGACADTMTTWIKNWVGGSSAAATSVTLVAPPDQGVGGTKVFPSGATTMGDVTHTKSFANTVYPVLRTYCIDCHRPNSSTAQTPYFANDDVEQAYLAAQPKIDLNNPAASRFVVRLGTEFHHCWVTTGSAPDCPGSAAAMQAQITAFANDISVQPVPAGLVLSKALTLKQGTIASGGNRYEANVIAKYEFKTGTGNTAYDTSGVDPAADLSLSGTVSWVGGWGINIGTGGKAQASTSASQKLATLIQGTNEYSIEVWAAPNNVAQKDAYIVTYSGSNTTRNLTLGQHITQYEARTRTDQTDTNGAPPLLTSATGNFAQAAMQHIVLTYDPTSGQKIYVNGVYTGDVDPSKPGSFANWDSTFALVLGNETTGQRQWTGVIKFAAIHNRALTPDQIAQNFAAGVGERYYMLFNVSALTGVNQAYIMMEGSQYDSYSYLLNKPTFISLDPTATPGSISIKGMRIGVNGNVLTVGQSYSTLNATIGGSNYKAAGGQLLSGVGAVVSLDKGPDTDLLFLSFDQIGNSSHAYVETQYATAGPVGNDTAKPSMGVRNFAQINATLSSITGVPVTDSVVAALYNTQQQSLPATPQIDAFLSSHQTAISQLAGAYCSELVKTQAYRDAFFGPGAATLDASLNAGADTFFGTATANVNNRLLVVNPLIAKSLASAYAATTAVQIKAEIAGLNSDNTQVADSQTVTNGAVSVYHNTLITRLAQTSPAPTTATVVQAACAAVLGSAAVSMQ